MPVLLTPPYLYFTDADGIPLADGKLYTYEAGTTTPKATYTDETGDFEAPNPIVFDAAGRTTVWIEGSYRFVVTDAEGTVIKTTDNVTAFTDQIPEAVIPDGSIGLIKLANISTNKLLGRSTPSSGPVEQITVGSGLALIGGVLSVSAGGDQPFVSITDFGASGDGVTDDTPAFTLAEADIAKRIFLPEGDYLVSGLTLGKLYYGNGRIKLNGTFYGQTYSNITTAPITGATAADYFGGDITHINSGFMQLSKGTRETLDQYYFNSPTTPHFNYYVNRAGHSGVSAKVTANASIGATSVTVNSASAELVNGVVIAFSAGANPSGALPQRYTITGVVGNVISFTPALSVAVTSGMNITKAVRTMNEMEMTRVDHRGGGDSYAYASRVFVYGDEIQSGQNYFFHTSTGGIIGGDMYGLHDGVFLTGTEILFSDTTAAAGTKNIACFGHVWNYNRNLNNGTYDAIWLGQYFNSVGTEYVNCGVSFSGKWNIIFDTVCATINPANNAALNMKQGHRIYFNSTATPDSQGLSFRGNVLGGSWIHHNGTSLQMVANSLAQVQVYDIGQVVLSPNGTNARLTAVDGSITASVADLLVQPPALGGSNAFRVTSSAITCSVLTTFAGSGQGANFASGAHPSTTSATGGAATALPAAPAGYMQIKRDGNPYKIAYYNP